MRTPSVHVHRILLAAAVALIAGCSSGSKDAAQPNGPGSRHFASPQEAVERITTLLKSQSWPVLASYYDLTGTSIDRRDLESGAFFTETTQPQGAHPGGFWRYKHPFAPGFKYQSVEPTDTPDVVKVNVAIEIDQGGGPKQRGVSSFFMRKSARGYQVLPDKAKTPA